MTTPPGWYPDPYHRFEYRYHNGAAWTRDVSLDGRRFVDAGERGPASKRATAALVLGIVSISIAWMPMLVLVGIGTAIAAILLGVNTLRDDRDAADPRFARAGVVTGGAALALSVVGIWFTVITYRAVDAYTEPARHEVTIDRCELVSGVATVEGTITNLEDDDASFTLRVDITNADTDRRLVGLSLEVDDVQPSEAGRFAAERPLRATAIDCDVTRVDGPLPFGFDLG